MNRSQLIKRVKPFIPHAAIVTADMYLVLFLIDRVNNIMNFIDNGYTRFLLLIWCVCGVIDLKDIGNLDRHDRHFPALLMRRLRFAYALCMLFVLVIIFIGAVFSRSTVMLNDFVKILILLCTLLGTFESFRLVAYNRYLARRPARMPMPRQQRPAPRQQRPAPRSYRAYNSDGTHSRFC